jgi:hypothetical protein
MITLANISLVVGSWLSDNAGKYNFGYLVALPIFWPSLLVVRVFELVEDRKKKRLEQEKQRQVFESDSREFEQIFGFPPTTQPKERPACQEKINAFFAENLSKEAELKTILEAAKSKEEVDNHYEEYRRVAGNLFAGWALARKLGFKADFEERPWPDIPQFDRIGRRKPVRR